MNSTYEYDTFTPEDWAQAAIEGWDIDPAEVWAFHYWRRWAGYWGSTCESCGVRPDSEHFRNRWGLATCYSCIRKYAMIDWIEHQQKYHEYRNRLIRHYRDADERVWLTPVS